jgi:hypothetical protein
VGQKRSIIVIFDAGPRPRRHGKNAATTRPGVFDTVTKQIARLGPGDLLFRKLNCAVAI